MLVKLYFLKLAWGNLKRNRRTFVPYILATSIISGVFLLISGLLFSDGLKNVPGGETARSVFSFGIVMFAIFAFFFMVYINNFIVGRRKKEFGLYGILGLERRHVGRVLVWENGITLLAGVLLGALTALVFGRLLFLALLKLIHAAPGSTFSIAPIAFALTGGLFFCVFVLTSLLNLRQVRLKSPMELLKSERKGQKDSKLLVPLAVLGAILLAAAYYFAWTTQNRGMALGIFFPLSILVIIATELLFNSGSIAALRALRANKRVYYKPGNFIAISGMFQRMRQSAKSLATICILSTMFLVTISGTLSLYLGQENILKASHVYDVSLRIDKTIAEGNIRSFEQSLLSLASKHDVRLHATKDKLTYEQASDGTEPTGLRYVPKNAEIIKLDTLLCIDHMMLFDVDGTDQNCISFVQDARTHYLSTFPEKSLSSNNVFEARRNGYATYGGLLFLGAFFGILFLSVTVLIIYFKQVSEGYEDKEQFAILQKVGMDDAQVKSTINTQVLWVFFIPLGMTILHMLFASKIMAVMLESFMLYDWGLVLACIGGSSVLFAVLYLVVYKLTAHVYYRIVKW
ncbi:MAG TPA: FtsX-like permease family protein [Clostridia bacterium]|nr:FtsX-like permease family protein [Clostridia bacterium]